MTRLWREGDPITVQRCSSDPEAPPARFRWQGRTHEIDRIWQQWQVDGDWWGDEPAVSRMNYAVTTKDYPMLCVIFEDLLAHTWAMSRLYD